MKILLALSFCLFPFTILAVDYTADVNCMGAWGMEDDGNETDLSGKGGTLIETNGDIPQDANAQFGTYSRDFESGDAEYLTHADGLSTDISGADQAISLVIWTKHESLSDYQAIMGKYKILNDRQYLLWKGSDDVCSFGIADTGSSVTYAIGATNIDGTAWFHIGGVYNDVDIRIYIGGSLDSNGASNPKAYTSGIVDEIAPFIIGTRGNLDLFWDGLLDDAGIFDRELSSVEVGDINTNGLAGAAVVSKVILITQGYIELIDIETDLWMWGNKRL
jgi:hypothetical protein